MNKNKLWSMVFNETNYFIGMLILYITIGIFGILISDSILMLIISLLFFGSGCWGLVWGIQVTNYKRQP